jgi:hypothetical protein
LAVDGGDRDPFAEDLAGGGERLADAGVNEVGDSITWQLTITQRDFSSYDARNCLASRTQG